MANETRMDEIYNDMNEEIPALVNKTELAFIERDAEEERFSIVVIEGLESETFEVSFY